jgi:hypothetical protein
MRTITIPKRAVWGGLLLLALAAGLLTAAALRPRLPSWIGGTGPDTVARLAAEASLTVDYRDQAAWKGRLYPLCSATGVAFWEENLRRGLWLAAERRSWVTERVEIADSVILDQVEVGDAAAAVVRVRGVVRSRTVVREEPFVQLQVLERVGGTWRFAALLAQGQDDVVVDRGAALALAAAAPSVPAGAAQAWLARPETATWTALPAARAAGVVTGPALPWLPAAPAAAAVPGVWPPGAGHRWVGR